MANVYQKDGLTISAGCIYGDNHPGMIAHVDGGKIIFNDELPISDEEKQTVSAFVAEAESAQETE